MGGKRLTAMSPQIHPAVISGLLLYSFPNIIHYSSQSDTHKGLADVGHDAHIQHIVSPHSFWNRRVACGSQGLPVLAVHGISVEYQVKMPRKKAATSLCL
jgi:hypothetical protein